jgi:hypothetical protein
MAIWGQSPTVDALTAKGTHDKAIELIAEQRNKELKNVRRQLCDVLAVAHRDNEAVPILLALTDELAEEGFFPKAIAVLKKVQRIDPLERGVEEKLPELCTDEHGRAALYGREFCQP